MSIKGKAYIAGIYEHPTRLAKDLSLAQIHAEVAKGALEDAGLTKDDVDGYFCAGDAPGLGPMSMVEYMGLKPRHVDSTDTGGSSYVLHVGHAAEAIAMGKCKIDGFTADLYDGGHIDLEFRVSTSDIDSEGVGILWASQKQTFPVVVLAPEIPKKGDNTEATGAEIDGTKGHPGAADANQGSLLDDQAQTPEGALAASLGADPGEGDPDEFSDDEGSSTDAGAAEQAELEAGMAQSIAAAGVAPKGVRRGRKPGAEVH